MLEKNNVSSFINENDIPDSQVVGCAFRVIFFQQREWLSSESWMLLALPHIPLGCSKPHICEMVVWSNGWAMGGLEIILYCGLN